MNAQMIRFAPIQNYNQQTYGQPMSQQPAAYPFQAEISSYSAPMYDQEKQVKVPLRRRISKKCWWFMGIAGVIVLAAVIAIAVALGLRENNDEWKKENRGE